MIILAAVNRVLRWDAIAGIALFAQVAAAETNIIIESRKEGQNNDRYKEVSGSWIDSNTPADAAKSGAAGLTAQGQAGSRKTAVPLKPSGDAGKVLAAARFFPKVDTPGHLNVYVTWPRGGNATPVQYVIKHAKGEKKVEVSQDGYLAGGQQNANMWFSLGDYDFAPGTENYVELRTTGESQATFPGVPGQAYADAMRFTDKPVTGARPPLPLVSPSAAAIALAESKQAAGSKGGASSGTASGGSSTGGTVTDAGPLTWLDSIAAALPIAQRENKKILILFTAPESERSRRYESQTFNDPALKSLLQSKFVLVRINMMEQPQLAQRAQVFKAGTINIHDSTGRGLDQIIETLSPGELASRLGKF